MNINEMEISIQVYHALANAGIETVQQLSGMSDADILRIPNIGRKSLTMIREALKLVPQSEEISRSATMTVETNRLRDEIAVRVMTTMIGSEPREFYAHIANGHAAESFRNVASISYGLADAMLKERGR